MPGRLKVWNAVTGLWDFVGQGPVGSPIVPAGAWGFHRSGAVATQASGNLPFATVLSDSHPAQYNAGAMTWTVPPGGDGLWLMTAIFGCSVTGAVTVVRGGIAVSSFALGLNMFIYPQGGTSVGTSGMGLCHLSAGDTISCPMSIVGGTSYTGNLASFSAIRLASGVFTP